MKTLKEQIAELRAAGYRALPAQAKVAHDAVLLAMHRSGFKLKSAIKGGVGGQKGQSILIQHC